MSVSSNQDKVISSTVAWIDKVVIGLNFCPFAKREVLRQSVRYRYLAHPSMGQLVEALEFEVTHLHNEPQTETTLIICAARYESFFDYLDALERLENWIDDNGYRGIYQIASFHPDYFFEGEDADSPSNFTNRSPYPMFHLLREESLDRAIRAHKEPQQIPFDNIETANQIGLLGLRKLLLACFN
ncbi:DUF1415 domain-containing protein [Aliiglaciecola sp. LCG003]|uniref:DUF1415 domain-containing protein n=1 Tax=Aliiglaciecola sp. LCG003 TaxID=3053655 RepID=UPI0025740699|nr:DUF1415 domain-containing protein [Aliiglaciecola sp. LCG003]WJG08510.1 DUF1415 domain-containing protein [Aliiglaciecola sp. LCG003]